MWDKPPPQATPIAMVTPTVRNLRTRKGETNGEEVPCQKSKSVDSVLHHCGPVTGLGVPWGFSSD